MPDDDGCNSGAVRMNEGLLARDELRPVRLQIDYLGAELPLRDHGVRHTIVVFGGTRLLEPDRAREHLAEAERLAARAPEAPESAARLRRARADLDRSRYYEMAREFGREVARSPEGRVDHRLIVVTGGGPGAMEAANRGAAEAGGATAGFNIRLPREQEPNPYITPGLCFEFRYFALRKMHFMLRARALVVLPGGYGTLDELFEVLCLVQTGKHEPMPIVLIGSAFWHRLVDFDFLLDEGLIDADDRALFEVVDGPREAWDAVRSWYARRGRSILD